MHTAECEHCGYDLTGLPRGGTCPECGGRYETRYGSRPRKQHPLAQYAKPIALFGLAFTILVCGGLVSLVAKNPLTVVIVAALFAAVPVVGAAVGLWSDYVDRRERERA